MQPTQKAARLISSVEPPHAIVTNLQIRGRGLTGGDKVREVMPASRQKKDTDFGGDIGRAVDVDIELFYPATSQAPAILASKGKNSTLNGDIASAADFGLDKDLDFDRRDRERGTARLNQ